MTIKCPYCDKKLNGYKAIYGHWAHCGKYHAFVKNYGKEARRPFTWVGYRKRHPKNWVNRKATQKSMGKPEVKTNEVKSS